MLVFVSKQYHLTLDTALGYVVFTDKEHPLASAQGRVYYHRHVASIKIGRWLSPQEVVHHIDGNRSNNSPENLGIFSREQHAHTHQVAKFGDLLQKPCASCSNLFWPDKHRSKFCSRACAHKSRRKIPLSAAQLEWALHRIPATTLGGLLGVSSSAIKRKCAVLGVSTCPPGFWTTHTVTAVTLDEILEQ